MIVSDSSNKKEYLLGIDIGTTSLKAVLISGTGQILAESTKGYPIIQLKKTWAEQSPLDWWNAFIEAVHQVLKISNISNEEIRGLAISDTAPTVLPVNHKGQPLRLAIIWMDRRDGIFGKKYLWIKKKKPKIFDRTHKFLTASAFLNYKLMGEFLAWGFWEKFPQEFRSKLPKVVEPTKIMGEVNAKASLETGLAKGTPVVSGWVDGGSELIGAGVVEEGRAVDFTGTSECLTFCTNKPIIGLNSFRHIIPNMWVSGICATTSGRSLMWLKDNVLHMKERNSYEIMDKEASETPIGADGLFFFPYLAGRGEGGPLYNPQDKGVFYGLSLTHTRKHFFRSVFEGCAFELRQMLEVCRNVGVEIQELIATGGGAKSKVWLQIKSNILNMPITKTQTSTVASAYGDAILAGVGVGIYKDLKSACKEMVHVDERIKPNLRDVKKYNQLYQTYKKINYVLEPLSTRNGLRK